MLTPAATTEREKIEAALHLTWGQYRQAVHEAAEQAVAGRAHEADANARRAAVRLDTLDWLLDRLAALGSGCH